MERTLEIIGELRVLPGEGERCALVVDTWASPEGAMVRVVPAYLGEDYHEKLTDRDVWVPAAESPTGDPMLLACWNSRNILLELLSDRLEVPNVSAQVLDAVRSIYLAAILPVGQGHYAGTEWTGTPLGEEEEGERLEFQISELKGWDKEEREAHDAHRTEWLADFFKIKDWASFLQTTVDPSRTGRLFNAAMEELHLDLDPSAIVACEQETQGCFSTDKMPKPCVATEGVQADEFEEDEMLAKAA